MEFEKKILECENIFLNQDYIYKQGKKKVILTSVHSMIQHKEGGIKKSEPFTKGITKYVSEETDCFYYIKLKETRVDSNSVEFDEFKDNLLKYIKDNEIKLLIDIHGAKIDRDFDVEFGTLKNLSIDYSALYELKEAFNFNGINNIKINDPFLGGGITKYIYSNTDIDIVQIEINSKFRDYNNLENMKKICDSLINFVNQYNDVISS
ncbi:MAG: hypothetical protein PHN42_01860 [Bacilli bacterium]|nr:hypothetical protein [Bacilli bacterium]